MFTKSQCFDISYFFQSSRHLQTSLNTRFSLSPTETHDSSKKFRDSNVVDIPNKGLKKFRRFEKQKINPVVVIDKQSSLSKNPVGSVDDFTRLQSGNNLDQERKINGAVELEVGGENCSVKKLHTKCSTKWASYGGCIPSILQALESVSDLDEAFRPWEERLSNKERSIILKEQVSWERAVKIFEWFKKKGCYELNVIHYNIMLRILGKARKWGELEMLWDEMKLKRIAPINSTYGTLIDVYSKGGLKEEALVWLQRMNEQGMEPDEVTMGIVVQMYKKLGEFRKAEEFFKMWSSDKSTKGKDALKAHRVSATKVNSRAQLNLSLYTYNTLIDTYGKSGQLQEMSQTFQKMLEEGVVPDTITFNTMIHIYGNIGKLEEVNTLVRKMEELNRAPDTRTYNILISLYTKRDDINLAFSYFARMKQACLDPDPVSYRTLLYAFSIRQMVFEAEMLISEMNKRGLEIDEFTQSALTRMYIDADMLEKSWSWFKRFHLEGNMTSECYSANIDAYGERGYVDEAEKVFVCCQEKKKLGVLEFNVMIKAYGIGKKYDKACQLFDSMEKLGILPDRCSYISLIQSLAAADLPHVAKPYLLKMQEAGLVNDCVPYCALISSFAKLGQLELAKSLYQEMIGYEVQPDVVLYGVLINASAESGNVSDAIDYIDALKKAGLSLNDVICNSLIKLYTKVGYLEEAEDTYRLLRSFEKGADVYSSNCIIDLYSKRSMVTEAEEIFYDLQERGEANEFSYAMMLCMYKRIGRLEEAMRIAEKMQELGLLTELLSYNSVLALFAVVGRLNEAVSIFKEMLRLEIEPDDSTYKSLGLVLVKSGVPKQAVAKLEVTRKTDHKSGLQSWVSALTSVVCRDNYGNYDGD
ncbi:pentatricopeptide repeat-containing protein At3g23020 [Beta vulgaris subsp. vulgaris]|uniref:pentatricopeptide repeat-containing protein At3g23020 n=1 Tax=Beta vulgaris subsp. vulgaris TaxID=3555 RepID=UPI00203687D4|nr:pentatricopeptide repeat-containing protein At3g23020 [Beta vulgaris subsp. vulgaris]